MPRILALFSILILVWGQIIMPSIIFAQEATSSASEKQVAEPTPEPFTSPTPEPSPAPVPSPEPSLWTESNGAYTTQILQLGITYKFPPNEKVSLTFTKLPEGSGTVTVREHEVPETLENAGSKDYEITSSMPNGSFSFDLTLPTNDPNKEVLTSQDGQNYDPVSNETITSSDTVTIKGITHLTHFIVADESATFNHVVINEFFADGSDEWVEIYNPRDQEENITGWNIYDSNLADNTPFVFPEGSVVSAKGFLTVDLTDIVLNDTGDTVNLVHNGEVIDSRAYDEAPSLLSIGRSIDGGPDWTTFESPYTRGASNGATLDTLYVDDDWNSPENDGDHTWGFDAFSSIQDAINFAPAGSTINVEPGTYSESVTIDKSLTITGPGVDDSENLAIINGCDAALNIAAGSVTVSGFDITNECGDDATVLTQSGLQNVIIAQNIIRDGYYGIYVNDSTTTIQNNEISYNVYGIYLTGDVSDTVISNNNIHDNGEGISAGGETTFNDLTFSGNLIQNNNDGYGVYFSQVQNTPTTLTISDNNISGNNSGGIYIDSVTGSTVIIQNNSAISSNYQYGIYLGGVDSDSTVTIGGNTIQSNSSTGIYLSNSVTNTTITGNTIADNGTETLSTGIVIDNALGNQAHQNIIQDNGSVGVQNNDSTNAFDATLNYWGDPSGPLHEVLNPNGSGNSIQGDVLFSPFYIDSELTDQSTLELDTSDISSFVENGIFDMPDDWVEGDDFVDFFTILQEIEFDFSAGGGETDVTLPEGIQIERSDGAEFAWASLDLEDIAESFLSGFDPDMVIEEAIQWGIPGVELEFSEPISISIFVGEDLNGQTLNVVRSTSGSGGWTSGGIVAPGTCVVINGLCTFQATLASYFATTRTVATSSTSTSTTQALSPAGGGGTPPVCNDAKPGSAPTLVSAVAGTNSVTLNWNKALNPVTYYLATYGLSSGAQQYGNPNIGGPDSTSYTVSGLSGGTAYYFKVRAGNGCAPGDFSNELSATPRGVVISEPAVGFAPGVLGIQTTTEDVGIGEIGQVQGEVTQSAQLSPTPQPQEIEASPFDAKVLLIVVVALLFGFGVFKLIVK